MGMKNNTGGEIVQVQGGHIIRSVGRKDRHSKVYTAKGPRDRRVRLAAHTAIQFYDVQDRLGYDRPSKAVDWLIKKAKSSIDKLQERIPTNHVDQNGGTNEMEITDKQSDSISGYNFHLQSDHLGENPDKDLGSGFNPQRLDSNAIADTMKTFFPITSSTNSTINFQSYPENMIARTTNSTEDLGLSLHTYQTQNDHQTLFNESNPVGYDASYDQNEGRFVFSSLQQPLMLGQTSSAAFSVREPLQSNFAPSSVPIFPWNDLSVASEKHQKSTHPVHQSSSLLGTRFASDGLMGFSIPERFGEDRASSNRHH